MRNFEELDKRKASEVEKSIRETWQNMDILNRTIENIKKILYFTMDQFMRMQVLEFIMSWQKQ